jgi:hypothetical protein
MMVKIVPKISNEEVFTSIVRGSNCHALLAPVIERMSRELGAPDDQIAGVLRIAADRLDGANTTEYSIKQRNAFRDEAAKDCRADFHTVTDDRDGDSDADT